MSSERIDGGARVVRLESAMRVDLAAVRETLAYFRDDLSGVKGCEPIAAALAEAIREIEVRRPALDAAAGSGSGERRTWWPRWR